MAIDHISSSARNTISKPETGAAEALKSAKAIATDNPGLRQSGESGGLKPVQDEVNLSAGARRSRVDELLDRRF